MVIGTPKNAVRAGQIYFQAPPETNTGQTAIRVRYNDAEIAAGTLVLERSAPASSSLTASISRDLARY
jgi:hypothetical protein